MAPLSSRTFRYARAWIAGPHSFEEDEIVLDREGVEVPATIVRPRGPVAGRPAWVVMHGITRPGRAHEQLVRFTRAVASAGLVVIVPEVPEWRELRLAPHVSVPTVAAAIRGLRSSSLGSEGAVGVIGFSFGAPHAIASAGHPDLAGAIGGVCGFGGYGELASTFRFMMSGEHEWHGRRYTRRPDPYGRWIVAANYLTAVPDHADATDVADALRDLAAHAGDRRAPSWDPEYDPVIATLRSSVAEERRALFDLFAPRSDRRGPADGAGAPPPESPAELAEGLAAAARRLDPSIDPAEALGQVERPVSVLHGRGDHLIPFTEAFRLRAALSRAAPDLTVTRLFGHSAQDRFPFASAFREVPMFTRALDRLLRLV
jgi:pimeloyl-ACP methyl ester carboxylesterase